MTFRTIAIAAAVTILVVVAVVLFVVFTVSTGTEEDFPRSHGAGMGLAR